MKITLGDEVKDRVSGFQGIAVAKHTYIAGCTRISIQPPFKKGVLPDTQTFDEPLLQIVRSGVVPEVAKDLGGPSKWEDRREV